LPYLHKKLIWPPSAVTDLLSPEQHEKEQARTGLIWASGTWTEVYFLTRLVVGTEATVQNQGSHRLTEKTQGPGAKKPRELWCNYSHTDDWCCLAGIVWDTEGKIEKEKAIPVQRDPSEGSFSSMLGLQRPLCAAIHQSAPGSHSGAPLHGARSRFPLRLREASTLSEIWNQNLSEQSDVRWSFETFFPAALNGTLLKCQKLG